MHLSKNALFLSHFSRELHVQKKKKKLIKERAKEYIFKHILRNVHQPR